MNDAARQRDAIASLHAHPDVLDVIVIEVAIGPEPLNVAVVKVRDYCSPPLLREHVRRSLGGRLIIHGVLPVQDIPLSDGAIDRAAATALALEHADEIAFAAPRNALEARLAELWSRTLGIDVGVHDDLLDLGASSMDVVSLLTTIEGEWGVSIDGYELIEARSVSGVAALMRTKGL